MGFPVRTKLLVFFLFLELLLPRKQKLPGLFIRHFVNPITWLIVNLWVLWKRWSSDWRLRVRMTSLAQTQTLSIPQLIFLGEWHLFLVDSVLLHLLGRLLELFEIFYFSEIIKTFEAILIVIQNKLYLSLIVKIISKQSPLLLFETLKVHKLLIKVWSQSVLVQISIEQGIVL